MHNLITIDGKGNLKINGDWTIQQIISYLCSACLVVMNDARENAEKELSIPREQAEGELYDVFNQMASAILYKFAPHLEVDSDRPAPEAVLAAENVAMDAALERGDLNTFNQIVENGIPGQLSLFDNKEERTEEVE